MLFIQMLITIAMFLVTVFGINTISEKGRKIEVGGVTTTSHLTNVACIVIAVITVAFDLVSLYVLIRVM